MRQNIITILADVLFWCGKIGFHKEWFSPVFLKDKEYVTKYNIIEITFWHTVTERNAPHEKRIRVGQPLVMSSVSELTSYAVLSFAVVKAWEETTKEAQ